MSEQSKQPATTSKSSDSDSASSGKAAETGSGIPPGKNASRAGQDVRAPESAGSSLDIPSSGTSRASAADRKTTSTPSARKGAIEKGLFDISEAIFPETSEKSASAGGSGKSGGSARQAKSRASGAKTETAKKSPAKRSAKVKGDALSPKAGKDTAGTDENTGKKPTAAARTSESAMPSSGKKPAVSGKTETGGTDGNSEAAGNIAKKDAGKLPGKNLDKTDVKIGAGQKPGARISSGGDPTIERKPALTTTTPIRKRKTDGGGGAAVLIALLVVAVAAGYYLLTQTGVVGPDRNEQFASTSAADSDAVTTAGASSEEGTTGDTASIEPSERQTAEETQTTVPAAGDSSPRDEASDTAQGVLTTAAGETNAGAGTGLAEIPQAPPAPALPAPALPETSKAAEPASGTPGGTDTDVAQVPATLAKGENPEGVAEQALTPAVLTDEGLREIEDLLMRLQIDPGPTDGVIDNRTVTAIRLYQEIAGLPVNGLPTPGLLVELREVVELLSND